MLRAVIIDDEEKAISVISSFLKEFVSVQVKISGTAGKLSDGIEIINTVKPDVVFLDIDLPDKNGLEIYKYFKKPDFKIIFVTAYNDFAVTALKNAAVDYLLKPIDFVELRGAIGKVVEKLEQEQRILDLEDKAGVTCAPEMEGQNILFEVSNGFFLENTRNIEYCYAEKAYSVIVTSIGKKTLVTKSLKELHKSLPSRYFMRSHKSYVVNINYIRRYIRANESYLLLRSGIKVPVSTRMNPVIAKTIKQMLES